MVTIKKHQPAVVATTALVCVLVSPVSSVQAGGFTFDTDPGSVTHPEGYDGTGGQLDINVCVVPGTPFATEIEQPLRNSIAVWNKLQSTSSNLRVIPLPSNTYDFESVALHEMGHCIGIDHPNLGSGSGVSFVDQDYTATTRGANGRFDLNAGADGLIGSGDDIRGDDISENFFYVESNNPFVEQEIVDSSTYSVDIASLPFGDTFVANADRQVGASSRYATPDSEAIMQQGTFNGEIQRTLSHDDVSTLRYAMSGFDSIQGTDDDYTVNLIYRGIREGSDCNINVEMDVTKTGFAACDLSGLFATQRDIVITQADMYFDPNDDWYFNNNPPCEESLSLEAGAWQMIALPCQVGISTSSTVEDVLADDLGASTIGTDWAVYSYDYTEQSDGSLEGAYTSLALSDELDSSKGYWIITNEANVTIDVQGEYNSAIDFQLFVESASDTSGGWNIAPMLHRFPITWADTVVIDPVGNQLNLLEADPAQDAGGTACAPGGPPLSDCKVGQTAFSFNGKSDDYERLTPTSGALDKFAAAWVFAGDSGYRLRFPMPPADLNSP